MKKYDIAGMKAVDYEAREKNVFHETPEYKLRVISLAPGERMPECEMNYHMVFVCIEGEAEVTADGMSETIIPGQAVTSEPATLSMRTEKGARMLGIQIRKGASE